MFEKSVLPKKETPEELKTANKDAGDEQLAKENEMIEKLYDKDTRG